MYRIYLLFILVLTLITSCKEREVVVQAELANDKVDSIASMVDALYKEYKSDSIQIMDTLNLLQSDFIHINKENDLIRSYISHSKAKVLYIKGNKKGAITYFQEGIDLRKKWLPESDELMTRAYQNMALSYANLGELYKSLDVSLRAAKYLENAPSQLRINIYKTLSSTYKNIGDLDHSKSYLANALSLADFEMGQSEGKEKINWRKQWASLSSDMISLLSNHLKDPFLALVYVNKAKNILEEITYSRRDSFKLANLYNNAGITYEMIDSLQKALFFYGNSYEINKDARPGSYEIGANLDNMAIVFKKMKNYEKAKKHSFKAMEYFDGKNDITELAYIYDNLGDAYLLEGKTDSALYFYDKAINNLVAGFESTSIYDLPPINSDIISDKTGLYIYLSSKAKALIQKYEESNDQDLLSVTFNSYTKLDSLADLMRLEYHSDASKESLLKRSKPIYDEAIEFCHFLYEKTGDEKYAFQAFDFAEKSKAIILLEGIRKSEAKTVIPEKLREEEKEIDLKKNFYEKKYSLAQIDKQDSEANKTILDSLSKYRTKHAQKVKEIVDLHPAYKMLKNNTQTLSPGILMDSLLSKDISFIEYYLAKNRLFCFVVTKSDFNFIELGIDSSFNKKIHLFNEAILQNKNLSYAKNAHDLYLSLIDPIKEFLGDTKELMIVPDGHLSKVSFDALLSEIPNEASKNNFSAYPYLLNKYVISYNYSATLWKEMLSKKKSTGKLKKFLAFSPAFPKSISVSKLDSDPINQLSALKLNLEEVDQISDLFDGKTFKKNKATIENFKKFASTYNIIHLATHAKANNIDGDYSYIVFSGKEKGEYDLLYARDLYTLKLQSELVVLSACETNSGELLKGEGVISLTRSFAYAGSKSLLSTLWVAGEDASMDICTNFYKDLLLGKNKARSLNDAKKFYLKKQEIQRKAHPYYWAGFTLTGNTESLDPQWIK